MDGILLLDKPIGWTSHDAVDFIRRRIGQRAVGHAGTLDPMATGLLVMLLGKATKLSAKFSGLDKEYCGTMTLGIVTDTLDKEGRVLQRNSCDLVEPVQVQKVLKGMTGELLQVPPAYSAIKRNGKKLCDLARAGIAVQADPRRVTVYEFEMTDFSKPDVSFRVRCSKGTYIRSLSDEVGRQLGCGAMLSALVRTKIGPLSLTQAWRSDDLASCSGDEIQKRLLSP